MSSKISSHQKFYEILYSTGKLSENISRSLHKMQKGGQIASSVTVLLVICTCVLMLITAYQLAGQNER